MNSTELLDIKVARMFRFEKEQPLKAFVDISVNDALLIKGMRVIEGKDGVFVSMPREQGKDQKWYDRVRCLKKEIRNQINDEVLRAYSEDE